MREYLGAPELTLDYTSFLKFLYENKLSESITKWLYEWNALDLALSPMEDHDRRFIRYGHYQGYFCGLSHNLVENQG